MRKSISQGKFIVFILCGSLLLFNALGCEPKVEVVKEVVKIEVSYQGDTSEGVVLDENNEGFIVTAITSDGEKEEIDGWRIDQPVTLVRDQTSIVEIEYEGLHSKVAVACSTSELMKISVRYTGDTEEGTILSDSNSGFKVTGSYRNGTRKELSDWTIAHPQTLKANETAEVIVEYEGKSKKILIKCSTIDIDNITAEYVGDTTEGTTIGSGSDNVVVKAHFRDGTSKVIKDWIAADTITLLAGETSSLIVLYEGHETTLEIKCTSLSPKQYKDQCESITYKELARNPEKYKGKHVKFTGEVIQVMEGFLVNSYRINVTKERYYWSDTVYVDHLRLDDSMPRILEDDIVIFYGEYEGLKTYTTIFGGSVTIPYVSAKYIDIK